MIRKFLWNCLFRVPKSTAFSPTYRDVFCLPGNRRMTLPGVDGPSVLGSAAPYHSLAEEVSRDGVRDRRTH